MSTWKCEFRTCCNFSVLCGYTKNEDGGLLKPRTDGTNCRQMTHLWMKITHANDVSQRNLELVADLLCEIARYELPYPHAFGQGRLDQIRKALPAAVLKQDARSWAQELFDILPRSGGRPDVKGLTFLRDKLVNHNIASRITGHTV